MISATFNARRSEGRAALVPYITAGYPSKDSTVEALVSLAEAGADVIELGIPFSDPSPTARPFRSRRSSRWPVAPRSSQSSQT